MKWPLFLFVTITTCGYFMIRKINAYQQSEKLLVTEISYNQPVL